MNQVHRFGVTQRWADAVVFGGVAYFVEVPDDPTLGPREQFEQVFRQVERRLDQVGSRLDLLIQVLVYLPNPEDLELFNTLWDAWIPDGHAPTRACTHPKLAADGYRVELVITAATSG
ncbi:MAG: RidA family protein [Pirellula sp.]